MDNRNKDLEAAHATFGEGKEHLRQPRDYCWIATTKLEFILTE